MCLNSIFFLSRGFKTTIIFHEEWWNLTIKNVFFCDGEQYLHDVCYIRRGTKSFNFVGKKDKKRKVFLLFSDSY